jgi:hypothetical protein
MDLLLICRKIWRYRLVTFPVIALTLLGALYVVAAKDPVYKASSSYVLINPPAPPTAEDIARDPALGRINPDNPYTRFSDESVIVSLLSNSLSNDAAREELSNAGADPRYTVAPDVQLGYSNLVVEITGVGSSPQTAVQTAELVGSALTRQLDRLQASQSVDPRYMVKAQQVVAPDSPKQQVSSTLRPLIAVLVIGAILLLVAVSGAEALDTLRAEQRQRVQPERDGKEDSLEVAAISDSQIHQGRRNDRRLSKERAAKPTMDGMTGLTQPERILRALSCRPDGTPAPPGELTLSGSRLRKRTGIKSRSMYAVTSRLRNEGKIERDERGWWRLSSRLQVAGNGHPSAEAARAAGAENGTEGGRRKGRTRAAPTEQYRR